MIDFVRISRDILIEDRNFNWKKWKERRFQDGTLVYVSRIRSVVFRYYPERERLLICGKILQVEYDSQVLNVDDIYGADLPQFVEDVNKYLNSLFFNLRLDICDFHVSRIDYCFNVQTQYVREYLEVMNRSFRLYNNGRRVNYVQRYNLNGSIYVKTEADFRDNTRRNYVLNFYDKSDRLEYLRNRQVRIETEDWKWAKGILRLEVQCGFNFVRNICDSFKMENLFGNLLSYDVALYAEARIFKLVFGYESTTDFYTYAAAKKLLPRFGRASETLLASSRGQRITGKAYDRGRKNIIEKKICPYAFLAKNGKKDMLENPIKLIEKKLQGIGIIA